MTGQRAAAIRFAAIVIATGLVLGNAREPAQEDNYFLNTKRQGKAVIEYRDAEIHVVAAYVYSQQNHASRWLLIESAMSTTRNMTIDRKNITLVTPGGRRVVALASQERFAEDVNRVKTLVQNASVTRHNVLSYFNQRSGRERMRLFALNSGPVLTNFVTDEHHVAVGDFYFESPTGSWEAGVHSLVIEKDGARAVLPIELQ
jgi:hypothetical protein